MSNGSDRYHLLMRKSKKSILKNCSKLIQYKDYFKDIMNSNYLVLVRHGQSEWNAKNLFTGWRDPGLTAKGVDEAHAAGKACLLYTSPSPRDRSLSRMPSSA